MLRWDGHPAGPAVVAAYGALPQLGSERSTSLPPLKGALQHVLAAPGAQNSARTPRRPPQPGGALVLPRLKKPQPPPGEAPPSARTARQQGVSANGLEARSAYNSIDACVCSELEAQVRQLVGKHESVGRTEEATGIYVVLERCHSCDIHHKLTTRHNEAQYADLASNLLRTIVELTREVVVDAAEMLCHLDCAPRSLGSNYELGKEVWHNASRVGAFEVYLLTPCPAPQTLGAVLHFPPARSRANAPPSENWGAESNGGKKTWGAQQVLSVGYVATLLHSKLCSNSWAKEQHIVKRLFDSLPLGTVTINVFSSSSLPLSNFTVEVNEVARAPSRKGEVGPPVQLVCNGRRGVCQIEDVPLQTELDVRINHSSMQTRVLRFSFSSLRVVFTLGTDIAFQLWILDVPGGVAIYASMDEAHPSRIPDKARPFDGKVEMSTGETVSVLGRMQMPWQQFDEDRIEPAMAFSNIKRFFVDGYNPAELESPVRRSSMKDLHQRECLEIAMLTAPEVLLTVVMPGSQRPLSGVRLYVENELQHSSTNEQGQCSMFLRPGLHSVKLMHEFLTGGWVENELTVVGEKLRLQVPLPLDVCVWRAPSVIRGRARASEVWVSAAGDTSMKSQGWEPFVGYLQDSNGSVIDVHAGRVEMERHPVVAEKDQGPPTDNVVPLARLSLVPPFVQRVVRAVAKTVSEDPWSDWKPRLLGTIAEESPLVCGVPSQGLAVRSWTCCCGVGVADIQVADDRGRCATSTGPDGTCSLAELPGDSRSIVVTHAALPEGSVHYSVTEGSDGPLELPLVFEAEIYVFIVEEPGSRGCKTIHAAGSISSVPAGALPFQGRLLSAASREIQPVTFEKGRISRFALPVSHLLPDVSCPFGTLQIVPEIKGFEWCPNDPSPLSGPCGLQTLISEGPVAMGFLRPVATVAHIDGRNVIVPIENCPTVSHVATHVVQQLQLRHKDVSANLVLANASGGQILKSSDSVVAGQQLNVLAQLDVCVTFGTLHVAVPGVSVSLSDANNASGQTNEDGICALFALGGTYEIALTHDLFGTKHVEVDLHDVCTTMRICVNAFLYVFMMEPEESDDSSPTAVWICAHPTHVQEGAVPVAGMMQVQTTTMQEVRLNEGVVSAVAIADKQPMNIKVGIGLVRSIDAAGSKQAALQGTGVALECWSGDHLWSAKTPWLLEDQSSWMELLKGPICAGWLHAPVNVRCHGFDKVNHKHPPSCIALASGNHTCASDICATLAPQLNINAENLAVFRCESRLAPSDAIAPRSTVDLWPLGPLEVCVQTGCCLAGICDVAVQVREAYLMDGTSGALPESSDCEEWGGGCSGTTGPDGSWCIVTNAGRHSVYLKHRCMENSQDGRNKLAADAYQNPGCIMLSATVSQGVPHKLEFVSDVEFYVFATSAETCEGAGSLQQVWFCSQCQDIPADAIHVAGKLSIPGVEEPHCIDVSGDEFGPVQLPKFLQRGHCPLSDMVFDVDEAENLVWCPEVSLACATSCWHMRLMSGPILAGVLKPAARLCGTVLSSAIRMSVDDFKTIGAIRTHLEGILDMGREEIGIFTKGSWKDLEDSVEVLPGQLLSAEPVASLMLRVAVPEGVVAAEGSPEGVPDVAVRVDGEEFGKTDEFGDIDIIVRTGIRQVCLTHVCFASGERVLDDMKILPGQLNECAVLTDVQLYFYATDPELEEDAEEAESDKNADGPGEALPSLVWCCARKDQIPLEAVDLEGKVCSLNLAGQMVSASLPAASVGLTVLSGISAEQSAASTAAFALSSMSLEITRQGFCWRPKDLSPFVEREQELGGCEYLRLLECPVAFGYLDVALEVLREAGGVLELPARSCSTATELKTALGKLLNVSVSELALFDGDSPLAEDALVKPGMELKVEELVAVYIQVVTGCCGEAFPNVTIEMDGGARKGITELDGSWSSVTTAGIHSLKFMLGGSDGTWVIMCRDMEVCLGKANNLVFPADVNLAIYTTDMDEESGDGSETVQDRRPTYDPSCVWVAADPSQIPEDVRPLHGNLSCETDSVALNPDEVVPLKLQVHQPDSPKDSRRCCALAGLSLDCEREGFCWCSKETSPLAERTAELGGCELSRLLSCPVALGFLKPTVTVHFPPSETAVLRFAKHPSSNLVLPMETHGEVAVLLAYLAEELGEKIANLVLTTPALLPADSAFFLHGSADLLCARKGDPSGLSSALQALKGRKEAKGYSLPSRVHRA